MRIRAVLVPPALATAVLVAACSSSTSAVEQSTHHAAASQPVSTSTSAAIAATSTPTPATPSTAPNSSTPSSSRVRRVRTHQHAGGNGSVLPVAQSPHDAEQVITVYADSTGSTTARLQAWRKANGGWQRYGGSIHAHLGSDGLSRHPSESKSATPIGSFTLTQAFGHDSDPGTSLKYTHTTPDDWWISQAGSLYNTRQRCSSDCGFNRGDPNEHLYYETPYYDYAVVIDYNTRNAPGGVHQGAGSAFFLHVTDGNPTAGCISIPQSKLVQLMRWLDPAKHPRILIGIG